MKVPNFKENKGITLAALVITIIVLLIIATITVSTLSGNNGIVEQTVTAKEESEIKSELKVVDLASNQAKNKNKYGDVTGEELVKALKNNAGEDQTEVEYYEKGSLYFVTFKKSNRVYEVTTAGYAKYVGKPEDAVVLFGKPKSSIAPKTSVEVNVIIKTLQENKIDKLEYVWNKSEDKQPSKEEFSNNTPKVLENVENEKTEKQTIVSLPEGTPEGEYYLWVKVTNNGEETIEHLGPYIIGEVSCQLAVDPNGGTWDGSSEVKVIKQSVGNKIDLKTPNPPANYEITFDADGGNVSKDKVTSVVSFNRWELKGVGTLEKNIYTFGKGKATATAQYSNEKITLPTATKDGYQIDGWYDEDGNKAGDPNDEYTPTGSEKLTAHWTPKSYELAFDYKTNGGTKGPDETQQVVYGKKVILSEIKAEKDGGWNFIGWNKKASDKTALDEITMGAQNEKVYALFKKDIRLTFKDKNGDKYSNPDPVTIYNNEKGTATAPAISEYTGWEPLYWTKETKADGAKAVGAKTGDNTISNITDPATYYARYKKDITIEFDLNGGTGTKPDNATGEVHVSTSDITKPKAATINMPEIESGKEPKKDGYVFNGWNTAQDGKGTHYDIDGTGSFLDSSTLYAEWTEKKAKKITLNKETATITYGDTTTIIATLEPADLVNKNVNWTTSDANICNISKATSVSGEEITLTAKKVGKATITATAADGSGKTATCVVTVVAKKITVPTAKTNLVYNAANQTGVEQTTEYNVTDGTKIDAGSYTAKVVLKDKTNTMWNDETTTDKTVDWSIAKKDITVEWKEQTSWVYDGTAHKPEVTTPINGAGQEKINLIVEGEKTNVGTDYTATAKISSVDGGQKNKDNYNLKDYTKKFSIREAVIIGKVTINGTNTYGETLTAEVSELDPSDATLKYQWFSNNTNSTNGGTKLTEPQDSKTYTIGKELVGKYIYVVVTATKPNFNSATFNDITDEQKNNTKTVAPIKITAPTAKTGLVYNGQEQIGVEDGSGYTVKDGTKKDAGNYTAKVELDDKENTIWNDGTTDDKSMPWSIAKKAITVKADNKTKAYGENVPELTATFGETGVQGETLKTSGQLKTTAEKTSNVGIYPITQGTLQLTDNGSFKASNYTINYTEGTLTITKIDNTLVVKAKTLTYNTQEQELVSQTGLQGDIYYSTDVELTKDNYLKEGTKNTIPKGTNAGDYKVYYYAPGNANYNAKSGSADVTIEKYSLKDAIVETVGSQIYTGSAITPKPEVKVNIPSEQNKTKLVEETDFDYSYKDNTAVGTATITITGKGNYKDSKPITFNIENKKQIKVSKEDYTGKYDGKSHTFTFNVTEPTSGYNVYYKVGTTSLNENNYTDGTTEEKPTRKDAGTTIVQWYIHTTNAQYADTNGSIEITINPKSIDVTADNKTKKYGEENPTLTATAGETGITGETAKIAGALKTTATKTSNVGTYVIGNDNVELKDNGTFKASNYEMNFINGTLTITKADNTLKVNAKTLTYNTSAQELVNEEGKQGDVYYSIGTELTSDNYNTAGRTTIPTGTNAGDYKVYYYTPGNDNYGPSKGTVDVTIEKYDLKNANMTQGALDYTGSKLTPKPEVTVNIPSEQNKTKLTAGTEFTYSYGANTNAGTNAGSVTITAKDNTNYTGSKTVNFNINKIANTLDVKARTLTYNTQAQELVTESKKHGDVYYSLETKLTKDNCDEKGSKNVIPKETNAGTYKVYYYTPGDTNYNEKDGFVDVTIEKYSLNNAEIDSVNAQIYTGSAVTPKPEVKVNIPSEQNKTKLVEGTDFDYSYSNNNGVGTAKVTVTGKGNYKDSKSITFTLADKKPIKVTPSNYSGTYNGEAHTFELNVTEPAGCKIYYKEGTETLTNSNYTKGTTEEKPTRTNAGTTTVQWYIHSTNAEYSDINGYSTITINPKTITVTADNKSRVYGEANPELTVTIGNTGITGETAKITGTPTTEAEKMSNVGSYPITRGEVNLVDNGTFKANNYKINFKDGTLTITAEENPVEVKARTLTYNTLAQKLVTAENVEGEIYYSVGTKLTEDNYKDVGTKTIPSKTDAGTYTVYYYVTGNDNYNAKDGNIKVTIEKYNLSNANMTQGAINYTGNQLKPTPEVTVNIPSTTNKTKLTAGEEFEYSYGDNINAGTNAGSITITAKDDTNYTGTKTINFTIAKAANPIAVTTPQEWSEAFATSEKTKGIKAATNAQGTVTYKIQSQVDKDGKAVEYFTLSGTTLTRKANTPVNKSNYTVVIRATAAGNDNYQSGNKDITVTVTVTKAAGSGSVTMEGWTYGGTAKNPVPTSSTNGTSNVTYKYKVSTAADSTYTDVKPSNAGTYTVQATFGATDNYNAVTATANFTINKASITIPSSPAEKTYNTQSQTSGITAPEHTSIVTASSTTSATDAGTYNVVLKLDDTANYQWSDKTTTNKTVSWKINKYNLSNATITSVSAVTYSGSEQKPTPAVTVPIPSSSKKTTLTSGTHFTYGYSNNTNVGTAKITVTAKDNTNYTGSKTANFTINKASITIPSSPAEKTYNTQSQASGITAPEHTSIVTASSTTSATDAGTYNVVLKLDDTANYQWSDKTTTNKTVSWKINKYNLSNATIATTSAKTYTGSAITPTPAVTVPIPSSSKKTTLTSGTHFTYGYSNNTNAGTAKITVTAKDNTNYTGSKTANFTIGQKEITVTAEDKNRAYGAANPALTYTHSGEVSGQTAGFTGALATSANTTSAPGNYDITQGDLALADNGTFKASNYKIVYTRATLRVDPKVTFNANGGTGTMSAQTVTYNKATALKQNTITREGYEFIGWNTEADGSGTTYANKANITATANTTLYAQWKYIATPNISVTDIDTFSYSAIAGAAYYVSTTQTTAPTAGTTASSSTFALNTWTTATNTGDLSLASGQIYYVWVKDEKGNVSPNKASISVLEYKVNYYKHIVGSNTTGILFNSNYLKNSETTKYALTGAVVTESNADLNINIDGYTYEGKDNEALGQMYIGNLGTESEIAKPSSGAVTEQTISNSGIIINLFYRANRLFVKYNVNGCTLVPSVDPNTGARTNLFGLDSDGFVKYLNNTNSLTEEQKKGMQVMYLTDSDGTKEWLGVYGGDANCINNADTYSTNYAGLSNYGNASYINITPPNGCTISNDKSWKAYKPDGTEVYYDQDKLNYMAENFAEIAGQDLKAGDVTIELYVNWWGESGWNQREGYWYHYNNSMREKGWIKNSDRWFYCYDSSQNVLINDETPTIPNYAMVIGWFTDIDGNKYYFSTTSDGTFAYGQMRTGWLKQDGYWYYLAINMTGHKTGSMLKSCSCTIGTKIYTFDAFGRCTNP